MTTTISRDICNDEYGTQKIDGVWEIIKQNINQSPVAK